MRKNVGVEDEEAPLMQFDEDEKIPCEIPGCHFALAVDGRALFTSFYCK